MLTDYRYPGSRSFQDTDLDRKLFFGRDAEKEELLHLILAEKLVVLFAKSGMGKTSLLNAGVLQPLREQGFLPCHIRFNDPNFTPLQAVFTGMTDQLAEMKGIEFTPGPETSLWEYFKAAECWSTDDTLLTPILILDQFEDFFDFHDTETRRAAITQLADLVKGRRPQTVKESAEYTDISPEVKIVIALREDYVGQLDELSRDIPEILDNRFRLTALQRQYAYEAIVKPAQVQDDHITTPQFSYAPEAITAILDFLCTRQERDKTIATNEVEPFQLQLLCQHLEIKILQQDKSTIQIGDLGGQTGMQKVLQHFYDRQIKRIPLQKRRRVRRLCERGLLTRSNRRLSLEEEDIARRFRIKKPLLNILVNSRLLRAEPRVGSVYYELCHDTLAVPIRKSSRRHKIKTWIVLGMVAMLMVITTPFGAMFLLSKIARNSRVVNAIKNNLAFPERIGSLVYERIGDSLLRQGNYDEALSHYRKSVELTPQNSWSYSSLGDALREQGKYDEALVQYRKALELEPENVNAYYGLGNILENQGKYDEALTQYQKAMDAAPQDSYPYVWLGDCLQRQEKYGEAIMQYQKALELDPKNNWARGDLGDALRAQGKYDEAIRQYQKMIEVDSKSVSGYYNLGNIFENQGKYDDAITHYQKAIELDPKAQRSNANIRLGNVFRRQGKYDDAIAQFQNAIDVKPNDAYAYVQIGDMLRSQGNFAEAMTWYQQAIELEPERAEPYISSGVVLMYQEKYVEAMAQYQKALGLDPKSWGVYYWSGRTLNIQGKDAEALAVYRQAVEIFPEDPYVHVWLGNQLSSLEQYEEAITSYQKALELDPQNAYALVMFGGTLEQQGNYAEAIIQYQQATEIDPANWEADVSQLLGNIAYKQGKIDETRQYYRKAYALSEKDFARYRENIDSKMWVAERGLLVENAEQAFTFADDVVKRQLFSSAERLAMRFIVVASLLYQQKRSEALTELQALFDYYRSLTDYNEKWWDYETLHNVIEMSATLTDTDKTLLLKLIDLLQSPKADGDQKLTELEAVLPELLQPQL